MRFVVGTRGSKLSLWQANRVADLVRKGFPNLDVEIEVVRTTGDRVSQVPLTKMEGEGFFTKELERNLLQGAIGCCVHSMKDVPTVLPEGLTIAAMLPRADVRDVLVARKGLTLENLPAASRVGTGSLRRRAQLLMLRPDLEYVELRGNLDTRISKVTGGDLDAAVLAASGIERMGWTEHITEWIEPSVMIPAVGQGAIGVEIREDDELAREICSYLNDEPTFRCVDAERYVMRVLEGGCKVPMGAWARYSGDVLVMDALVCSLDGSRVARSHREGNGDEGAIAASVVDDLISEGARAILDEARTQMDAMLVPSVSGR